MKTFIGVLTFAALSCIGTYAADRAALPVVSPVHVVAAAPGVVPSGIPLFIRTVDTINTRMAHPGTVYEANVAENVVGRNGVLLIPRESPVELVVRSFPYLGPGGAGMTGLTLRVEAITVNDMRYPVATIGDTMNAGGIRAHPGAIRTIGVDENAVEISGRRIRVPGNTLLVFRTKDPIRLSGYQQ